MKTSHLLIYPIGADSQSPAKKPVSVPGSKSNVVPKQWRETIFIETAWKKEMNWSFQDLLVVCGKELGEDSDIVKEATELGDTDIDIL